MRDGSIPGCAQPHLRVVLRLLLLELSFCSQKPRSGIPPHTAALMSWNIQNPTSILACRGPRLSLHYALQDRTFFEKMQTNQIPLLCLVLFICGAK